MEVLNVSIHWCEKNYACVLDIPDFATIAVTDKSLDGLKRAFTQSLRWTIEDSLEENEFVPEFLKSGDYQVNFSLAVSALLRSAEQYITMSALSKVTGINQKLLSNYASEIKLPRQAQKEKIVDGLRKIGSSLSSLSAM